MASRNRRGDHGFDLEMRILHRFGDIADRRAIGEHDVDIDAQPLGMQPLGIGNAIGPVERIMRRLGMQHRAPVGLDDIARSIEQLIDIVALDPPPADIDLDLGNLAGQPRAGAADPDARDTDIGHLLGALDGIAHGIGRRRHIGDIAAANALRGAVAGAEHHHLAGIGETGDHRGYAEGADIDGTENAADAGRRHQSSPFFTAAGLAGLAGLACLVAASPAAEVGLDSSERPGMRR